MHALFKEKKNRAWHEGQTFRKLLVSFLEQRPWSDRFLRPAIKKLAIHEDQPISGLWTSLRNFCSMRSKDDRRGSFKYSSIDQSGLTSPQAPFA